MPSWLPQEWTVHVHYNKKGLVEKVTDIISFSKFIPEEDANLIKMVIAQGPEKFSLHIQEHARNGLEYRKVEDKLIYQNSGKKLIRILKYVETPNKLGQ
ncbi:MAG: hypothetical protein QXR60_01105 [Candidatus Nanoarchaeia archaeon]